MTLIQEIFSEDKMDFENIEEKIQLLFKFLENKESNENEVKEHILKLLNIFNKNIDFAQVFVSSPKFNSKKGLIEILINLFLDSENLREDSKNFLKFLIESINFEKKYYDYVYCKIGKEHRENLLTSQKETDLLKHINAFGDVIEDAAITRAPNKICNYVHKLATYFHSFYSSYKINDNENIDLTKERLALVEATRITLKNALALLDRCDKRSFSLLDVSFKAIDKTLEAYKENIFKK